MTVADTPLSPPARAAEPVQALKESLARPSRGRADGPLLAAGFAVLYLVLALSRWANFRSMSWDLGIFVQVVESYAHLRAPVSDLKGPGFHILGDHFSPVLVILAPFYRIWPTPATLLIAQSLLLGWSVWPVTNASTQLLGRRTGVLLAVAYGLSWGLQKAADFDFHEIAFAVPIIASALSALVTRRWRAALLWTLPLVLVKEDLGLTATAIALVIAWRCRRSSRLLATALATAALGALCCLITVTVVIPAFNPHGYDYWTKMGTGPGALTALTQQGTEEKVRTLVWTLLPTTGLLALRSPVLLAAVPTLAWRFVSNDEHYWSTDWHYSAVLMPITALALADALSITRFARRPVLRSYARHLPTALLATALALSTNLPFSTLTEAGTYRTDPMAAVAERTLATIPDGATVEADIIPTAHLAERCRLYWMGNTHGLRPEYIASYDPGSSSTDVLAHAEQLHPRTRYTVTAGASGYWVLKLDRTAAR
ncbi:DUF2079 domain-containing protein [Streptomyces sp. Caat 7-52]|uniref:DUF2079 domain-containing protein n=1 Tax=Streptomyces sp. Caat 7-52 TaxID=2949637 RepID=UPI0020366458|nr:DUF2079 domain-containing protein [Streptomyces sp. Caat 7-52]